MQKKLKNAEIVVEDTMGVCVWYMPDGSCLGDDEGRFLSIEGPLNNFVIEEKMRKAAIYYLGSEALLGKPLWLPGTRKITDNESDDQMERFLDGYIPDPVDSAKQLKRQGVV